MKARTVLFYRSFWTSRVYYSLRDEGDFESIVLAVWLITSDRSHRFGIYEAPDHEISEELGMDWVTVQRCQRVLEEKRFAYFDRGWVFVISMARYQLGLLDKGRMVGAGDRRMVGVDAYVNGCPSRDLKARFFEEYSHQLRLDESAYDDLVIL